MPDKKQQQISQVLQKFYNNPVAKVSVELFLSVGAILFFALFVIQPTLVTMSDLLKEIEDKKALNVQLDRKVAALATAQSEYLELEDELVILNQALPDSPKIIYSIKVIEKIAGQQNLVINSINMNEVPDEQLVELGIDKVSRVDVPISISITGDYPNIRQFVEELQLYRRVFVVDTVVFASSEEQAGRKLVANITAYIPYLDDKAPDDPTKKASK